MDSSEDRNVPVRWITLGRWCYPFGITFGLTGLILLIAFSILLAGPYIRTMGFSRAICETISSNYTEKIKCNRKDTYVACLVVKVNVTGQYIQGILYDTELDLTSNSQCTWIPGRKHGWCDDNSDTKVARYKSTWGSPGRQFSCLYSSGPPQIIRTHHGSTAMLLHIFLWPGLAIVYGITVLAVVSVHVGWGELCQRRPKKESQKHGKCGAKDYKRSQDVELSNNL